VRSRLAGLLTRIRCLIAISCLIAIVVGACGGPPLTQVATSQFETDQKCPTASMTLRPDVLPGAVYYEITGCGTDFIYMCIPEHSTTHHDFPASCSRTAFCPKPGCATDDQGAVRDQFVKDAACPVDRVTTAPSNDPATPPADVAGDAARLSIWTQAEHERTKSLVFVTARGCNVESIYSCQNTKIYAPLCTHAGVADAPAQGSDAK
jgi:hypothetical protein